MVEEQENKETEQPKVDVEVFVEPIIVKIGS